PLVMVFAGREVGLEKVTEPVFDSVPESQFTGPFVGWPATYAGLPTKPPTDGVATENVKALPEIDSVSVTSAVLLVTLPDAISVWAAAVVVPGIGMPVTVSVYVAVAISLRELPGVTSLLGRFTVCVNNCELAAGM